MINVSDVTISDVTNTHPTTDNVVVLGTWSNLQSVGDEPVGVWPATSDQNYFEVTLKYRKKIGVDMYIYISIYSIPIIWITSLKCAPVYRFVILIWNTITIKHNTTQPSIYLWDIILVAGPIENVDDCRWTAPFSIRRRQLHNNEVIWMPCCLKSPLKVCVYANSIYDTNA